MRILGIDPGEKGGIAILDAATKRIEAVWDMPTRAYTVGTGKSAKQRKEIDPWELEVILRIAKEDYGVELCVLEKTRQRPSTFSKGGDSAGVRTGHGMHALGVAWGLPRMGISMLRIPYGPAEPSVWKKALGAPADTEQSAYRAAELFPEQRELFRGPRGGKRNGVAEAAMIALWGATKKAQEALH